MKSKLMPTLIAFLFVTMLLIIPKVGQAQSARASGAAAKAWPAFWSKFKTAVNKGDRAGVRKLMSSPFNENCTFEDEPAWSADRSIAAINTSEWNTLRKLFALGTEVVESDGRPRRITTGDRINPRLFEMNIQLFEFRADGRWYWLGCYCVEC